MATRIGKKAIALFLNQVHGYFQSGMVRIVREFAEGAGLDLFVLAGQSLRRDPLSTKIRNPALDLVASRRVAGVLLAGTIIEAEERQPLATFLRELGKPVFSISNRISGLPCVLSDGRAGIMRAVEHLARDHGRRRIAFLGGPSWSYESADRLDAYRSGLAVLGIESDPALEFPGDFDQQVGRDLAEARARGSVPPFDGLICANDGMAIGFQAAGEALGLDIPRDVALCGFDDSPEALILPRPLSTVRQPFTRLYRVAGEALLAQMADGQPPPAETMVPTEFIIRESCGCTAAKAVAVRAGQRGGTADAADGESSDWSLAPGAVAGELLAALEAEARGRAERGSFLDRIESTMKALTRSDRDLADLPAALSGMFSAVKSRKGGPEWIPRAQGLLLEGELLLARAISDKHIREIRYLRDALTLVNAFSQEIGQLQVSEPGRLAEPGSGLPVREIVATLDRALQKARIGYCALSVFASGGSRSPPEESLLCYARGAPEVTAANPLPFSTGDILPDSALPPSPGPFSCIALPLIDSDLVFGFLFFTDEPRQDDYSIHEIFRSQVSNALGRARFAAELLEEETRMRVETEKLEAMGTLVAGVAHEINTPIGVCVTAASHAGAGAERIRKSFAEGSLTRSELEAFLADGAETAAILASNLERAAALVASFKRIAVDASSEERRFFRLKDYFQDILATLSPRLKRSGLRFEIDCPEALEIDSYPGALTQVFTNLVLNSLAHGYEEPADGTIRVRVELQGGILAWTYRDDGKGIPREIIGKIFDPYFTTKRDSGGSGLGLYIVYNIVAGVFKGRITAAQAPGGGAQFTVTMPLGEGEYRYADR